MGLLQEFDSRRIRETFFDFLDDESVYQAIRNLQPKLSKDGDKWCYLLGINLQEGIAGFGDNPFEAARDFYREYCGLKKPNQ